jgi:hypothetical protein
MPLFDPDTGKVIDKDALKSVSFGMTNLRDAGSVNAAPKRTKAPGQKARPSVGYP